MNLEDTLEILIERDRLLLRIENLEREKAALNKIAGLGFEVDDNLNYVNSASRLVWSLVGLFIVLYALYLDKRFENVEIWDGFFVIGIVVLGVYALILRINHKSGKTLLMSRAKIRTWMKGIEKQKEEAVRKEKAIKIRLKEIEQEQIDARLSIDILEKMLNESIVPLQYRQTGIVRHFKKSIDNLRAQKLSDAIWLYNEEKKDKSCD